MTRLLEQRSEKIARIARSRDTLDQVVLAHGLTQPPQPHRLIWGRVTNGLSICRLSDDHPSEWASPTHLDADLRHHG